MHVSVLTRQPKRWNSNLKINYRKSSLLYGNISLVSDNPKDVIPNANIVIITAPSFGYKDIYLKIKPYLKQGTWLGAIPGAGGFEFISNDSFLKGIIIFGMQRSPYNCKIIKYGRSVDVMGVRGESYIGSRPANMAKQISSQLEKLLNIPIFPLSNYLNVTITPANALLHSSRVYSLFHNWQEGKYFAKQFYFYETWDDLASKIFLDCDSEIQSVCKSISLDLSKVISIRDHYNINNPKELSNVIRNIESLKGIKTPLIKTPNGFIPDYSSRFFSEDLAINLLIIKSIAKQGGVETPAINKLLVWGEKVMNVNLLDNDNIVLNELNKMQFPQFVGLLNNKDVEDFYLRKC